MVVITSQMYNYNHFAFNFLTRRNARLNCFWHMLSWRRCRYRIVLRFSFCFLFPFAGISFGNGGKLRHLVLPWIERLSFFRPLANLSPSTAAHQKVWITEWTLFLFPLPVYLDILLMWQCGTLEDEYLRQIHAPCSKQVCTIITRNGRRRSRRYLAMLWGSHCFQNTRICILAESEGILCLLFLLSTSAVI